VRGPGYPVEVFNALGAGDAFMSGFLRGWLRDAPLEACCSWANACGAFAVSRLLCSPEFPTWEELERFVTHGGPFKALRLDPELNHIHWATTRRPAPDRLMAMAIDRRNQLEQLADEMARHTSASPTSRRWRSKPPRECQQALVGALREQRVFRRPLVQPRLCQLRV
jgi:hypothetical protein